jgi:hypothetical protein
VDNFHEILCEPFAVGGAKIPYFSVTTISNNDMEDMQDYEVGGTLISFDLSREMMYCNRSWKTLQVLVVNIFDE